MIHSFDAAFADLLERQRREASGQRLEMLNRDLTGTRRLLQTTLWPILKSLDGIVLEQELVGLSGVKTYFDVFYEPLGIAFECDGFAPHGELLTRDRFNFERMRIRSAAVRGWRYFPFSYDEVDKKPEVCQRAVYELMGRCAAAPGAALLRLAVPEREIIRFGWRRSGRTITLAEACECLGFKPDASRAVLKRLVEQGYIQPIGTGTRRHHAYRMTEAAMDLLV